MLDELVSPIDAVGGLRVGCVLGQRLDREPPAWVWERATTLAPGGGNR
ncbi:MAG: hypothetical protein V5A21_00890 [Halapricum sp.]